MRLGELIGQIDDTVFYGVDASSLLVANAGEQWVNGGAYVRWLMGSRMVDKAGLLGECAAALQFPWYFGRNWDALDECLSQMAIPGSQGVVLLIYGAAEVLLSEEKELRTFVKLLVRAREVYSASGCQGSRWDRPALPFHVVLQMKAEASERWQDAGAHIEWLQACVDDG